MRITPFSATFVSKAGQELLVTVNIVIFEMARDYDVILPWILAVGIACYVRKQICPEMQAALDFALRAREVMRQDFLGRPSGEVIDDATRQDLAARDAVIVAEDSGEISAVISADTQIGDHPETLGTAGDHAFLVVYDNSL